MHYRNSEMRIDQLIGYFNDNKINLIPPFQRGHVWSLNGRQKLVENIVGGRPIPAIFLYKEPTGSKYSYNILDGKQRLESLLLFIGGRRPDVKIDGVNRYFFSEREKKIVNFPIHLGGKKVKFADLSDEQVREFREYSIATIEISMEESSLDEIITLFIDINQQGVKVNRFTIVQAFGKRTPILQSVFNLIAQKQTRGKDIFYKKKNSSFARVLDRLQIMHNLDQMERVDRIWERLLEIALFSRTNSHRTPPQILNSFIRGTAEAETLKLKPNEIAKLSKCFSFLAEAYSEQEIADSKFATDQTHFYTMVTSILFAEMLSAKDGVAADLHDVRRKLKNFAMIISGKAKPPRALKGVVNDYLEESQRQTTHQGRRQNRQARFLEIMAAL